MASQAMTRRSTTVRDLVALPQYRARFNDVLKERTAAFLGSLVALTSQKALADCDPQSVVAAAFQAATLDLPIEKGLGFAWVVPYKGVGQFQLGWKGVVQLALRSGQYKRMNAFKVNAAAYKGLDDMGEAIIDMGALDPDEDPVGYAVTWQLMNGFKKTIYWSLEKCLKHAERYSQAYRSQGKFDTPWKTHRDEMCLKTVITNGLRQWGILSVQMQKALEVDQTVRMDMDSEPVYIDAVTTPAGAEPEDTTSTRGGSATENLAEKILRERKEKEAAAAAAAGSLV